ncbi:MAG TPA: glycoside hydrolase family 9 protein [Verrucomicrobiae bacterium]|nr:glycoside hydrolase family 9 protein [Verrucomicrobiae bacterium]
MRSSSFVRSLQYFFAPVLVCLLTPLVLRAGEFSAPDGASLELPKAGEMQLRCITPSLLGVTLITTQPKSPGPQWDFVTGAGKLELPATNEFVVTIAGSDCPVSAVGFKRRVAYAPLKQHDIRIGNHLYLKLSRPIAEGQSVEVKNPDGILWPASQRLIANCDPLRWSPAIHVNEVGYLPDLPKKAMVGFYLGSLGEMGTNEFGSNSNVFQVIDAASSQQVFQGTLTLRRDHGFPFANYQQVLEADFSTFKTPGEYRLQVPGLGASFPFFISDEVAGAFARTYALGLYHQRCGTSNALPFTRFTHDPCHTAPAEIPVPQSKFQTAWEIIANTDSDFSSEPRHTAPQLKDEASQLYPFVKRGKIDVSGGHHDAGDYSKYTINSAGLIHILVFAADNFPGAGALDNLGIPESGDGRSDLLQEAKWEADFLAKMQDDDGGFFFLVYPREREYESEVLPDHGDPQIVWPKNTAVSAAATAALAQCASSPLFKKQFPEAAKQYLQKARAGWAFLERALAAHGRDGAYQKLTHYGNDFMHDDELAWAACEMYLATGDESIHQKLFDWLKPGPDTRKWGWWRLYSSWGCAIRDYAFAARSGRINRGKLDRLLLAGCEDEIIGAAQEDLRYSEDCAYGSSFPEETKRTRTAGWYFSGDQAFDLAVACQLDYPIFNDPRPKFLRAISANLNFEAGCNPVNVSYITGLGWKRQHEIVDQYAQNQRRMLPPDGIPIGNIQGGYSWVQQYQDELSKLTFPWDGDETAPYAFYDRWADTFNLNTEFVVLNQAKGLAYLAWLMARTPLKDQPWKSADAHIVMLPSAKSSPLLTATIEAPGVDLKRARIVWEWQGHDPEWGKTVQMPPLKSGSRWVEAEAQLPDGRRVFAVTNLTSGGFWRLARP